MTKSKLMVQLGDDYNDGMIYIPRNIMHSKLGDKAKLVYSVYNQYETRDMNFISKQLDIEVKDVVKAYRKLIKAGWIEEEEYTPQDIKREVLTREKQLKCEWCHEGSLVLHSHHYPIPKRLGGEEVVNICPNCHYAFHSLESQLI